MKHILLTLLIAVAAHPLIAQPYGTKFRPQYEKEKNGPHGECRTGWTKLQDGLDYRTINCLGDQGDLDLHVVRVDIDHWRMNAAIADRSTARMIARDKDASFAINANFFDRARNPIGAIVRSGSVVHEPHASGWQSIFLIDEDGRPRIVMPSRWKKYRETAQMAVQAGPRLVIGGHSNKSIHNNYAAARAGVCIQRDGDILFFATPQDRKFHITEIARVARRDEADGGLACYDAMLFDGGHSVNLFAEGGEKRVSVDGDPVPVFVYATPRVRSDASQ